MVELSEQNCTSCSKLWGAGVGYADDDMMTGFKKFVLADAAQYAILTTGFLFSLHSDN